MRYRACMFFIEQMVQDKRLYEEFSIMKALITVFNLKILFFNSKAKCTLGADSRVKKLTSLNGPKQQAKRISTISSLSKSQGEKTSGHFCAADFRIISVFF